MDFDSREWVNEIIAGTVTGAAAGAVAAVFVPDPPFGIAIGAGATAGFVTGLGPGRRFASHLTGRLSRQSLGDFLIEAFPRFRGGGDARRFPMAVYAVFFLYVVAAAQIAILLRRALARRARR